MIATHRYSLLPGIIAPAVVGGLYALIPIYQCVFHRHLMPWQNYLSSALLRSTATAFDDYCPLPGSIVSLPYDNGFLPTEGTILKSLVVFVINHALSPSCWMPGRVARLGWV